MITDMQIADKSCVEKLFGGMSSWSSLPAICKKKTVKNQSVIMDSVGGKVADGMLRHPTNVRVGKQIAAVASRTVDYHFS
jgi:hypothetical protein